MPKISGSKLFSGCVAVLAMALALAIVNSAQAASAPVDIRVLTADGKTLVDHRQYVAPIALRTSPRADCFGQGTGGSGQPVRVSPLTALGALQNAARVNRSLNPILITDHDFGFPGLGLCGIAGPIPSGEFWFLKTDRRNPQISADQAKIRRGASVVFYRMKFEDCDPNPPYACASELVLNAPARVKPGQSFRVRVTAFDDAGKRTPVEGARVTGTGQPTDASGFTHVTLRRGRALIARKQGSIPSSPYKVCVSAALRKCPPVPGLRIVGSTRGDRITGTAGPDLIQARQGPNVINVRGGGRDRVICLGRRQGDVVLADRQDIVRGCKTVRRR